MPKPNVLYLHSHDTGRYVQPYGHAVPTPNLQRLAEGGVVFRQAFCAGPTCSASRAGLLTGRSPHGAGMIGLAHRGFSLARPEEHLVHTLRRAGYRTTLAGMQHVAGDARDIGYDEILPTDSDHLADVVPAATGLLEARPAEPFFLSVGFFETHRPWDESAAGADPRFVRPPAPIPDAPETRRDMAGFIDTARRADAGFGQVLAALEGAGLDANTLVIATTDHGIPFPKMKCNLTDHGTGVMLILRGPGGFEGGRTCDALVSHLDVYPTLCELLAIDPPPHLEGRSMMPLVRGEADEINEAVFSEVTYHAAYEPKRAVRTKRWKYIRRFDGRTRPVLPNIDPSPTKTWMLERGWADVPPEEERLFDLAFDPNEEHNLLAQRDGEWAASAPRAAEALEEMRRRLDEWMERTEDPLLNGPVPPPKGAKLNDPDGLSPEEPTTTV